MSKIKKIEDLNKGELLNLIYNKIGSTRFQSHPCFCVICSEDKAPDDAYGYVCTQCEIYSAQFDLDQGIISEFQFNERIESIHRLYK